VVDRAQRLHLGRQGRAAFTLGQQLGRDGVQAGLHLQHDGVLGPHDSLVRGQPGVRLLQLAREPQDVQGESLHHLLGIGALL
jgi:hypothetical protein